MRRGNTRTPRHDQLPPAACADSSSRQSVSRTSPAHAYTFQGWVFPALGLRAASESTRSTTAQSTGSGRKPRMLLRSRNARSRREGRCAAAFVHSAMSPRSGAPDNRDFGRGRLINLNRAASCSVSGLEAWVALPAPAAEGMFGDFEVVLPDATVSVISQFDGPAIKLGDGR
jgi:hypothetical protein